MNAIASRSRGRCGGNSKKSTVGENGLMAISGHPAARDARADHRQHHAPERREAARAAGKRGALASRSSPTADALRAAAHTQHDDDDVRRGQLVVTAGPWAGELARQVGEPVRYIRKD